jgi:MYXO-CTERM domain-containing protein
VSVDVTPKQASSGGGGDFGVLGLGMIALVAALRRRGGAVLVR